MKTINIEDNAVVELKMLRDWLVAVERDQDNSMAVLSRETGRDRIRTTDTARDARRGREVVESILKQA